MEKFIALTTVAAFLIFAGTYALSVRKIHGGNEWIPSALPALPARSASRNFCSLIAVTAATISGLRW